MNGQVFLSYSRKDKDFVDKFLADLKSTGINVWFDQRDIHAGDKTWQEQIVDGILKSPIFVIVLSPNSVKSDEVNSELIIARQHKKTIVPVLYKPVEISKKMQYQLAGKQYIDFSKGDYSDNLLKVINNLSHLGAAEKTINPENLPIKSENPLKKIPIWGWVGAAVVLLIILVFGANSIIGGRTPTPTEIPMMEELVLVEVPTDTEIPPTETLAPTEEDIIVEEVILPTETLLPDTPTATEIPSPTPYPAEIADAVGVEMVFVPAGEFVMGSNSHENNAYPAHPVETGAFYIDKFEVTNANFDKCVEVGACDLPRSLSSNSKSNYYEGFGFYPVIWVSWHDAVAFCEWRGGRLPTEAEWEKAARGVDDARTYPWGDEIGTECVNANYWEVVGCGGPREVGSTIGISPFGAYEMAGNVWEWVQDDIILYPGGRSGSVSNNEIGNKVLRGGSWQDSDQYIKTTFRLSSAPNKDANDIGFRCVIDIPLP